MLKLNIHSQKQGEFWLEFNTQSELDAYLVWAIQTEKWGRNSWQEVIPPLVDENEIIIEEAQIIEHPAEWSYDIEDISEQVQKEQLFKDGKKRQELGAAIVARVYAINEAKNISPQTFAALLADEDIARIERMLWTGSLRTAKLLIQNLDNTYFTEEEKQSILDMLADY